MSGDQLHKILYVEDNPHMRSVAKLALEEIGHFKVRECCSGSDALLAVSDFEADLILLDVQAPGTDGVAALSLLRRLPHLIHTPAMFVTGLASASEVARYVEAGAAGIIAKPLEPLRLAGQVRMLWEGMAAHRMAADMLPM